LEVAKKADVVVFFGGLNKSGGQDSEGSDRKNMALPYGQDELIAALVKANKNVIVVLISGNAVSMPWVKEVPAIVQGWYCGTETGTALAAVLSGDVNPSGKLPMTFPVALKDNGAHALGAYPGDGVQETYDESIFVGYRWLDKQKIKPLFCFGHGLSYTSFEYGKMKADKAMMTQSDSITVSIPVKNTGNRTGSEVVQLYIRDIKSSLPRPIKELKGFRKITLSPDEEKIVRFVVKSDDLKYYDDKHAGWVAEKGQFEALIGASSSDIRNKISFVLE
ncbi:MAG TPA: glycoside hydrolase family 3 C-terminal domain-containing protein, partial [Bacteroidales bacterium]